MFFFSDGCHRVTVNIRTGRRSQPIPVYIKHRSSIGQGMSVTQRGCR